MRELRWEPDSRLSLAVMTGPAVEVRFVLDETPAADSTSLSQEVKHRSPGRPSGLPRLGQETLEGEIARR